MRLKGTSLLLLCLSALLLPGCWPGPAVEVELPTVSTPMTLEIEPTPPPPSSTVETLPVSCDRLPPAAEDGVPLPDLTRLRWAAVEGAEQRVRYLAGFGYHISRLDPSPDGRWVVVTLESSPASQATAVIDTEGENHWWANTNGSIYNNRPHAWLPDNRLLWVDQAGKLFVGDGKNRHDLQAPAPVGNVWYAGDGIAFAATFEMALWRVEIESGEWEPVSDQALGSYFSLAHDGSYGIALHGSELFHVPAEMGAGAGRIGEIDVEIVARAGGVRPGIELADSPYWFIGLPALDGRAAEDAIGVEGFVVDTGDGRRMTAQTLSLPDRYRVVAYHASPDGRWLAAGLMDDQEQPALYLTPAGDPAGGTIIEAVELAGWHPDTPAAILRQYQVGTLSIIPLPAAGGESGTVLDGAGVPLVGLPESLFFLDGDLPARLLRFDPAGNRQGAVDLTDQLETIHAGATVPQRVLAAGSSGERLGGLPCTSALVEWTVTP